jgi:hypothetical protein
MARSTRNEEELNALISNIKCSNAPRIRNDILTLCAQYSALRFRSTHTNDDGSETLLIEGTIPITFKSVVYHIPIELLVSSKYPNVSPICFVRPVKGMKVVQQHRFVDTNGKVVFHPYLTNWSSKFSNLVTLTNNLVEVFSQKPPVFSVKSLMENRGKGEEDENNGNENDNNRANMVIKENNQKNDNGKGGKGNGKDNGLEKSAPKADQEDVSRILIDPNDQQDDEGGALLSLCGMCFVGGVIDLSVDFVVMSNFGLKSLSYCNASNSTKMIFLIANRVIYVVFASAFVSKGTSSGRKTIEENVTREQEARTPQQQSVMWISDVAFRCGIITWVQCFLTSYQYYGCPVIFFIMVIVGAACQCGMICLWASKFMCSLILMAAYVSILFLLCIFISLNNCRLEKDDQHKEEAHDVEMTGVSL